MKDMPLKFIFLCLCSFCLLSGLKAQSSALQVEDYRNRYLWLQTANPAGLVFNSDKSFSVAEAAYLFTNGDMRTAVEAASQHSSRIHTESYRRVKQVQFYGRLGYENRIQNERQWQVALQPKAHLINFGDTVAGRQTIETYNICGGAALPLGKGWSIGANLDYYARSGRKHIDPRNQNDQIDLSITPGILYRRKALGLGACFTYRRIGEKVDYSILDGEVYDLGIFYPLWFCVTETFQSGTNSLRVYMEERVGGALQLWGETRRYEWLSEFDYAKGMESCDISVTAKSRTGETERQELNWNGQFRFPGNTSHTFRPVYQRLIRTGYDNLQSKPESSAGQSYLHYGRTKRSAIISDVLSLDYTLFRQRDSLSGSREIKARIAWQREQTQFFVYPVAFTQIVRQFAFSGGYTRQFLIREQNTIGVMAEATYSHGYGSLPKSGVKEEYPLPEIKISQKHDLLTHDFRVKTAETLHCSVAVQYTRHFRSPYAVFVRSMVNYFQGLSSSRGTHRLHGDVSAGLLF